MLNEDVFNVLIIGQNLSKTQSYLAPTFGGGFCLQVSADAAEGEGLAASGGFRSSLIYGKEIQEVANGQPSRPSAQDLHQADQAAVWSEQVPNALDHLRQRSSDRIRLGTPSSPLISKWTPLRDS